MIKGQKIFRTCITVLVFCIFNLNHKAQKMDDFFSKKEIKLANTASQEKYLDDFEKEVILLLNLARSQPKNFLKFYRASLRVNQNNCGKSKEDYYHKTLEKKLMTMTSLPVLTANAQLTEFARCWAGYCGEKGITGHNRNYCKSNYSAQCCAYGGDSASDVVWMLLIDRGVKSLGHREICLSASITQIGVAKEKHLKYGLNAVLDFK
ncbi:MAG: CAP domain-containing protein [Sphingobacteriaceae bacterium]|nr:CAP domain-containing protein [Sphingobacteriaceae bacterium]